jgi:hypothetical protein
MRLSRTLGLLVLLLSLPCLAAAQTANTLSVRGAPSGGVPALAATGVDANISINLVPKGTGVVLFSGVAGITGGGTAGFLPVFTTPTVLGNSLWLQDTASRNLLAPLTVAVVPADMASFFAGVAGAVIVDPGLYITSISNGVNLYPYSVWQTYRGTYLAPTKNLQNDILGSTFYQGWSGTAIVGGHSVTVYAFTDLDNALPVYLYEIIGTSARDLVTIGSNTAPVNTLTNVYQFGQGLSTAFSNAMVLGFNAAAPAANTVSLGVSAAPELVITANRLTQLSAGSLAWSTDLFLTRSAAALLHLGAADAAAPVAQGLGVQNVLGGTTDTAGALWTLLGSRGTGTGAGGNVGVQVAYPGLTGTAQNPLTTVVTALAANSSTNALQDLVSVTPIVNQSGTASYNGFTVDVTRTAVGSGVGQILALKVGGVQRFGVTDGAPGVGTQLRVTQATPPTCSANCGTTVPAVVGTDFSMLVTMGSGGVPTSPFTVTFNGTYPVAPSCHATAKVAATAFVTNANATQTTVVVTTAANPAVNNSYNVVCTPVT